MQRRTIPVRKPVHDGPYDGRQRKWTELRFDNAEFMTLLGMPEGARLISMRADTINGAVVITVEEPLEV